MSKQSNTTSNIPTSTSKKRGSKSSISTTTYAPSKTSPKGSDRTNASPALTGVTTETKSTIAVKKSNSSIENIVKRFEINDDKLKRLKFCMLSEINRPITMKRINDLGMKMLPSYIRELPDGKEQGTFLVLDIRSVSFRLLIISIAEGAIKVTEEETFGIADEVGAGSFRAFFYHVAYCIKQFITVRNIDMALQIVICMGYPLELLNAKSGYLIGWTKEHLRCVNYEKKDIAALLLDCLVMQGETRATVVLICNDTTALLMYAAHANKNCRLAITICTGTNATYIENNSKTTGHVTGMIINTEWAAFGEDSAIDFVKTSFDRELDAASVNPGKQTFEKMTSSLYTAELVRRIIVHSANTKLIFKENLPMAFRTPYSIGCKELSQVDSDVGESTFHTRLVLAHYDYTQPTAEDLNGVKTIVSKVMTRSAHMVAAGIAALLERSDGSHATVGISGSLIRYMPSYKRKLETKLRQLVPPTMITELLHFQGIEPKGAAIAAAVVLKREPKWVPPPKASVSDASTIN